MFEVILQKFSTSPFIGFFKDNMFGKRGNMLYIKMKRVLKFVALSVVFSLVLFTTDSFAAEGLFGDLTATGGNIFMGMREIVFAVSGFGIVAVAVGGFFGNLNWKWLSAIIIGLVIIAVTGGIINYMTNDKAGPSLTNIHDTLKNADDSSRK